MRSWYPAIIAALSQASEPSGTIRAAVPAGDGSWLASPGGEAEVGGFRSAAAAPGRPGLEGDVRALTLRMTKENPNWGCVRIRGEQLKLGYRVSATAIRNRWRRSGIKTGADEITSDVDILPASAIVLTDFFSVDTVFLVRRRELV